MTVAVVSVNVEALRQEIEDLEWGRDLSRESAEELQQLLWGVNCSVPQLSEWTGGEAVAWFVKTIRYLKERLAYAELAQEAGRGPSGLPAVVSFDDVVFATIDNSNLYDDVQEALAAVKAGDATKLAQILSKHIIVSPDLPEPYYDPVFAGMFANSVSPAQVADMLVGVDKLAGFGAVKDWYAGFLDDLAGTLSAGAKGMSPLALEQFTKAWAGVNNDLVVHTLDASRMPEDIIVQTPRIQALSLLVARGDWPDTFLDGVLAGLRDKEGDQGAAYWLAKGDGVRDPALVDPDTGQPVTVVDPMFGVYQAGVLNPEWFKGALLGGTDSVEYITAYQNDTTHMFETAVAGVDAGVNRGFRRGFDQASYAAFMNALATVDFQTFASGGEPSLLNDAQIVAKALLLEDYLTPKLPGWLHDALDILGFLPGIDWVADGFNALFYWLEGNNVDAGICAASVFIPGIAELPVKGLKWLKRIFKIGAKGATGTVWDFVKATQPLYPGMNIPKSFELDLGNGTKVWVHGNATDHFEEYFKNWGTKPGTTPGTQDIGEQTMLLSLREAVKKATENGIPYTKDPIEVGGWSLKFAPPEEPGLLPALIHAKPTGE